MAPSNVFNTRKPSNPGSNPKRGRRRGGSLTNVSIGGPNTSLEKVDDDGGNRSGGEYGWLRPELHRASQQLVEFAATPVSIAGDRIQEAGRAGASLYASTCAALNELPQKVCNVCGRLKGPVLLICQCLGGIVVGGALGISQEAAAEAREAAESERLKSGSLMPFPDSVPPAGSTLPASDVWSLKYTVLATAAATAALLYSRYSLSKSGSGSEASALSGNNGPDARSERSEASTVPGSWRDTTEEPDLPGREAAM